METEREHHAITIAMTPGAAEAYTAMQTGDDNDIILKIEKLLRSEIAYFLEKRDVESVEASQGLRGDTYYTAHNR